MKNKKQCYCNGTGQFVVCMLCRDNIPHSNCDDSYSVPCSCKKKEQVLKGGLERAKSIVTEDKRHS